MCECAKLKSTREPWADKVKHSVDTCTEQLTLHMPGNAHGTDIPLISIKACASRGSQRHALYSNPDNCLPSPQLFQLGSARRSPLYPRSAAFGSHLRSFTDQHHPPGSCPGRRLSPNIRHIWDILDP